MSNKTPVNKEEAEGSKKRVRDYIAELNTRTGINREVVSNLRPEMDGQPGIELRVSDLKILLAVADYFSLEALDGVLERHEQQVKNQITAIERLQGIINYVRSAAFNRKLSPEERVQQIQEKLNEGR